MSGHFQVRKLLVYQKFRSFRTPFWVLKSSKFRITQQGYPIQNLRRGEPIGFGLGPSRQEIQEPPCMGPWDWTDRSGHQIWPQNDLVNGYLMVINGDSGWWFGTWLLWRPFHIWDVILPIDELIFFRGVGIPPTRYFFKTSFPFLPVFCCDCLFKTPNHRWGVLDDPRRSHSRADPRRFVGPSCGFRYFYD